MTNSINTYNVILEIDNYLKDNCYFDSEDKSIVNQKVLNLWDIKLKSAIIADIKLKFGNLEVDFVTSEFQLTSEDSQGVCLFLQSVIFRDKVTLEFIKAFTKTLVNYNQTSLYLDSVYATLDKWQGKSEQLKKIFDQLKSAVKHFGYFNPISLTELVK